MTGSCIECGEKLTGRADKKYCSSYCRTSYYNRQNSNVNNLMRNINRKLRNNRRILASINIKGKTTVREETLTSRGFAFNYFTNTFTTKAGKTYYFCYDQGYLQLDQGLVTLVVRQDYVDLQSNPY